MAKFLVQGRDAGRLLNHISANNVDGAAGMITYTQWLNEGGTLEADLTVTKIDAERFWVVASDPAHRHVETWMRRHAPADAHFFVTDVTSGYAQINIQGPRSREVVQAVTTASASRATRLTAHGLIGSAGSTIRLGRRAANGRPRRRQAVSAARTPCCGAQP